MNVYDGQKDRLLNALTQACGVLTAIFGFVALFGWIAGLPLLCTFGSGRIPMASSTALLFLLFGTEALVLTRSPPDRAVHRIGMVIASVGTLIALLLFFLSYGGIYLGAEHLGIRIDGTVNGAPIGHMSPLTAFCFVLVGLSFLASLSSSSGQRWPAATAFGFASLVVLTSVGLLLAYLFGSPLLYGSSVIPPALSTSLAFLTLGTALMLSSVQRVWPRGKLLDTSSIRATYMLVLIFVSLATGIVVAGYFYFKSYEESYKVEIERQLSAIAEMKVGELVQWRKERLGDGAVFYKNPNFAGLVRRFLEAPGDRDARLRIQTWLNLVREAYQYDRVFLLDTKAVERISAPEAREPIIPNLAQNVSEVFRSGQVVFLDFHRDVQGQPIHLSVLVPIFEKRNPSRKLGILVLRIDPEKYLYPFINRWPTPSKTAETLIIRRDGNDALFLNELRFRKNTALNLRSSLENVRMAAVRAALGQEGIVEGIDYRGVPVIAYVLSVPNSPWFLVTRMDVSEIYGPLREKLWEIVILIGALLICAGTGVGMVWRHQRTRFYRQRYEAAEALQATEARYRNTLDNMLEGCQTIGFDWRYLYVNDSAARYGRQDKKELLGHTIMERYPGVEGTKMFAVLRRCMEERTPQFMENEFTYPDGAKAWFELCIQPVPEGIFILSLDITERKRVEESLRESEKRYRQVVENATEIIYTVDDKGNFNYGNPAGLKVTGYSLAELRSFNYADLVLPEHRERVMEIYINQFRQRIPTTYIEFPFFNKAGKIIWFGQNASLVNEDGRVVGFHIIARDITERKKAEQALAESEQRYRNLVENAPDVIFTLASNGTIASLNPAFEMITGWSQAEWLNKTFHTILHPDDLPRGLELFQRIMKGEKIAPFELRVLRKSGDYLVAEFTVTPQTQNGSMIGMLGIARDITERKRMEEALQITQFSVEHAPESVFWIDSEGHLDYVNEAACRSLGYAREELLSMSIWDIDPDFNKEKWTTHWHELPKRGPSTRESHHRTKEGMIFPIEITGDYLRYGEKEYNVAFVRDITDRKQAEERLRLQSAALEAAANAIIITDHEGMIEWANPALTVLTGYSHTEVVGRNPRELIKSGEQNQAFYKDLWDTILAGKVWRGQIINRRKDGSLYSEEMTITPLRNERGEISRFIAIKQDITERKRAEEALRKAEEKYRGIFENATEGIFQSTPEGRFISANPALTRMYGYGSPEEYMSAVTDITRQLYVHPEQRSELIHVLEKNDVVHDFQIQAYRKDGAVIWCSINARAVRDSSGKVLYLDGVIQDITERKKAEEEKTALQEQLRQSQKMEAIGQLAGGIAHDFNNLLTVIKGYSQLSQMELKEGDPLKENLGEIGKAAERAANLTRQILAFSRRQMMEMRVLELNTILQDLDKMLRRVIGEDVELVTLLTEDLGRVKTDPGQIEQVIMNLAVNARDAMPHGGKLTIETANVKLDEEYARSHIAVKPGHYVMLAVSDTGVGMAPEIRDRVFEPFFTTKEKSKGTGLGLSTVYGIVKQSGGNIWVYSEPNHGTTFKIYLPRVDEPLEELKEEMARGEIHRGGETILLVEDEEEVRKLATRVLERQGYTVLEARDGEEALFLCQQKKEPIHLILTDVVMPQMGGPQLVDQLRQVRQDFKVLYMSGYTDNAITHRGVLEKGMNYIQKPFTIDGLARKVREVLDK